MQKLSLSMGSIDFSKREKEMCFLRGECPSSFNTVLPPLKSQMHNPFLTLPSWANLFGIHFPLPFRIKLNFFSFSATVFTLQRTYLSGLPSSSTHRCIPLGQDCPLIGNFMCVLVHSLCWEYPCHPFIPSTWLAPTCSLRPTNDTFAESLLD